MSRSAAVVDPPRTLSRRLVPAVVIVGFVLSFSAGANVIVAYNPHDPADSEVDPRIEPTAVARVAIGLAVIIFYVRVAKRLIRSSTPGTKAG